MNRLKVVVAENKVLVVLASMLALTWLFRSVTTGSIEFYGFIAWNMFLAVMPLLIEQIIKFTGNIKKVILKKATIVVLGFSWLLFLPNAFYILTDFMHLNPGVLVNERQDGFSAGFSYMRGDGLFVLDSLVVFVAATFGAFVGGLALVHLYKLVQKHRKELTIPVMSSVLLLTSVGVYIGRFGRWNSWDALYRPFSVVRDLAESLMVEVNWNRFIYVVLTMVVLQVMSMFAVLWFSEWSLEREKH